MLLKKKNCNCDLGQNCNRTLHSLLGFFSGRRSKVRFTTADRAAVVSRRSMSVLEGFRLISRQIKVTRFPLPLSPPPEVSSTVTQKPKNQSHEHMDVVAHRALSPLSAASGASPTAEGMESVHAGAHLSSQVSRNSPHQHPLYWLNLLLS